MTPDELLEAAKAAFAEEGRDLVQRLTEAALKLEAARREDQPAIIKAMLRDTHNLKGAAGSIGFKATGQLVHAVEGCLKAFSALEPPREAFDVLQRALDVLAKTLADRRMTPEGQKMLAELEALAAGSSAAEPKGVISVDGRSAAVTPTPTLAPAVAAPVEDAPRVASARLSGLMLQAGELSLRLKGSQERVRQLRAMALEIDALSTELKARLGADDAISARAAGAARGLSAALRQAALEALHDDLLGEALHDAIRSLRLQPLSGVFRTLPKLARDVARALGKEVVVTVSGAALAVEKPVLDMLRDALGHLIRNAVDHGIEPAPDRLAAGKSAAGRIHASARTRGTWLIVEVDDDGRGIDAAKVREAAVRSKVLSGAEAEALSAEAAADLVFHAGLSTKAAATDISGRGVGLDVVREEAQKHRGTATVVNRPGKGATFVIQVPLQAHRGHVLLSRVGEEQLALPSSSVWKVLRLPKGGADRIAGQAAVEIEGVAVPVVTLGPLLWAEGAGAAHPGSELVALKSQGRVVACAVDEMLLDEEVVIRELEPPLKAPAVMSGVAVRGNGSVVCILDPNELVRLAGVQLPVAAPEALPSSASRARKVLVVDDSFTVRILEKSILELAGYVVVLAQDGEEALSVMLKDRFDVVVSDINMPRRDGFALLEAVRQSPSLRQTPFILVSSRGSEVDRKRGLDLGASAYVVKSEFDQEILLEAVTRLAG